MDKTRLRLHLCCFGSWRSHASKDLLLGETDHFILGVIRNLCALTAQSAAHAAITNNDNSPQRRHGFAPKVATTPAETDYSKPATTTSAISRIGKPSRALILNLKHRAATGAAAPSLNALTLVRTLRVTSAENLLPPHPCSALQVADWLLHYS